MGRWSRAVAPVFLDWLGAARRASWLDVGCGTGILAETLIELCAPETFVAAEPCIRFRESRRLETAQMRAAPDRAGHQAGILQNPHMFRSTGETHLERGCQFPDREFALRQLSKHRPARWVRERVKNGVEMSRIFNHVV